MRNPILVASVAAVGLLSSTLALAEVTDGSATTLLNSLEAPATVSDKVATPLAVEPAVLTSSTDTAAPMADDDAPAASLTELVSEWDVDDTIDAETKCLATAVFYEARSESLAGQLAVANVVIGRAKSGRFPSSLCGVVTQPGQFSFVRGGRLPDVANGHQWHTAQAIAEIALENSWANPVEGALYFHAARVSPGWNKPRMMRIGGHVFYR